MNKNLFLFFIIINITEVIYSEIFSDLQIKNNTDCEVKINTYCDIFSVSKGTELIIPKNGEAIIEGTARFFGSGKYVGWSEKSYILIYIDSQKIGPIKANSILTDFEPVCFIVKIERKYYLVLENENRIIPSHE